MKNIFHRIDYLIICSILTIIIINFFYYYFAGDELNKVISQKKKLRKELVSTLQNSKIQCNRIVYQKEYLKLELMVRNYIPFDPSKINMDFIAIRGSDSLEHVVNDQIIVSFKNYLNFKYKLSNEKSKLSLKKETSLNAYFSSYEAKIGWLVDDKASYLNNDYTIQQMNMCIKNVRDSLQVLNVRISDILNNAY